MRNKKKVVFDTNTLISAFVFKGIPEKALNKAEKECTILISNSTIDELLEVISRKKFNKKTPLEERLETATDFISEAILINPVHPVENECRDPKDVQFLELAHTAKADYIVSGDSDLLDLNPFKKIQIVTPAEFLEVIDKDKNKR